MRSILTLFILTLCQFTHAEDWIAKADFGAVGRHRATGLSIKNKGYIGMGHYNGTGTNIVFNDWWEYDPASNSWSQKADCPTNNNVGNYGVIAFAIDNYGYVGGGQLGSATELYQYDPTTNNWEQKTDLLVPTSNVSGFAINGKGYYVVNQNCYEYDSANDQWNLIGATPFSANLWNSSFVINNKGYIKNGNQLWEFKPLQNLWIQRANFPGLSTGGSASFVQNNYGFIVAGYNQSLGNVNSEVFKYSPTTNTWLQKEDFHGTSRRFSVAFSILNRAYIGTGTNGTNFNDFWEYKLTADIENESELINISIFPNPSSDIINIHYQSQTPIEIEIYSIQGRRVNSAILINGKVSLDKNDFISGDYIIHFIEQGKIIQTRKITFL